MNTAFLIIKPLGKTIFALLRLVRIGNVCMITAGVYLGAFLVQGHALDFFSPLLLKAASAEALLGAAGYVMNDLLDAPIDKVNRPSRPLVTGEITVLMAWVTFGVLLLGAVGLALSLTVSHQLIFLCTLCVLVAYNMWLSKLPLIGNLSISAVVALAIPYGALPFEWTPTIWIAAGFAFVTMLAREVVKDVEDVIGDRAGGANTLPVLIGTEASVHWVHVLSIIVVLGSVLPYLIFDFGGLYLILISVTDLILLLPISRTGNNSSSASFFSSSLKWAMLFGMVALSFANSVPTN